MEKLIRNMGKRNFILLCVGVLVALAVIIGIVVGLSSHAKNSKYEDSYQAALLYYVDGDYASAITALGDAAELRDTEECRLLLARCYAGRGDYERAVSQLETWLSRHESAEATALLAEYRAELDAAGNEDTLTIGGKQVGPEDRSFALINVALGEEELALLAGLSSLHTLSLENCSISDISFVSALTELETLTLSGNEIQKLSPLSSLSALRTLYINENPIEDFSPLYTLTGLKTLSLRGIEITEEQLEELQNALPDCSIFSDEAKDVAEEITLGGLTFKSDVEELDLTGRNITDISLLSKCTALKRLDLKDNDIKDLSPLVDLQQLEWLCIWNNEVTDLAPLLSLSGLKYLDADGNEISSLAPLSGHTALTDLFVSGNPLSGISTILKLPQLEKLGLKEVGLSDADLESIGKTLTKLATLYIDDNEGLSGNAVEALKAALPNCNITHSDDLVFSVTLGSGTFKTTDTTISASGMGVSDLSPLSACTELRTLLLSNNSISDISVLSALPTLEVLELQSNGLTDISALSSLGSLRVLDLIRNSVSDISALSSCTALQDLHLSYNSRLEDIGALRTLTSLRELSLDYTAVSDLSPLSELTGLEALGLEGCDNLTDLSPLYSLSGLRTLYISGGQITQEQISALRAALPSCSIYN